MKLAELAKQIEAEVVGDPTIEVNSVAPLERAGPGQVSFLSSAKHVKRLASTSAAAVIVGRNLRVEAENRALLTVRDPVVAFAKTITVLHGGRKHPVHGIHPKAHVEPSAEIGENTVIYPGCVIGPRVRIGRDCVLHPNVVVYEDCVIGDRCIIHGGTVIGADGYAYAMENGAHLKIPQIGNVVIEEDVEIGPNCTISRAALDSTVIGKGTKIDQQVVVGHNVRIGAHCLLVAQVGLAGSVTLGRYVTLAGQVGVAGHLKICDNVQVGGKSAIMQNIEEPGAYVGIPAMPYSYGRRVYSVFTDLPQIIKRVRELESRLDDLTADEGGEVV
jgi:UDP-3-O-[3-hydroxymyristoyl] glucosamine N-acyltransferase